MADAGVFTEAIARQTQSCHIYHVDSSVRDVTAAHRLGIPGSCPARGSDGCTVLCSDGTRRLDCVRYGQNESGSRIADGLGAYLASIRCSILKSVELTAAAIFGFLYRLYHVCTQIFFSFARRTDRERDDEPLRLCARCRLSVSEPLDRACLARGSCTHATCQHVHGCTRHPNPPCYMHYLPSKSGPDY